MTAATFVRERVYDPLLRLIHAWNAVVIVALIASGFGGEFLEDGPHEASFWFLHVYAGYALMVGLVVRLFWGLVGPRSARLSDLWHPAAWREALRGVHLPRRADAGHDPLASIVFLTLYALLLVMVGSGFALAAIEQGVGPLAGSFLDVQALEEFFGEPHEAVGLAVAALVGVHLAALAYHQFVEKLPTAQAMLTGIQQRGAEPPPARRT